MVDVKKLRPDWRLARRIAKEKSLAAAQEWMQAALVDLRGCRLAVKEEIDKISAQRLARDNADLQAYLENPPWVDAVYLFSDIDIDMPDAITWVVKIEDLRQDGQPIYAVEDNATHDKIEVTHIVDAYSTPDIDGNEDEKGWKWWGSLAIGPGRIHAYGNKGNDRAWETQTTVTAFVNAILHFIAERNEHFVEMRPEPSEPKETDPKKRKKMAKQAHNCPWLRENAPRVILLDPSKQYPTHGRELTGTGARTKKAPHQRRGHWRTLRAERFGDKRGTRVWVRPAWIGDKEWVFRGNVYRVLDADQ